MCAANIRPRLSAEGRPQSDLVRDAERLTLHGGRFARWQADAAAGGSRDPDLDGHRQATDSLGTVAPGKLADLVLLDADPLAEITNTTTIRAVVANGRYFDRAALDQLLARVQATARRVP